MASARMDMMQATIDALRGSRMDQLESDVTDVQGHMCRGGGGSDLSYEREWDLLHKGDLKEFNGDKKHYRAWIKKVQA